MMVGGECPNCGEYTNASTSRLVRDACGHRKCRMCLVYEEEGCKACQSEHRIQRIGSFDYPVPSSPLVSVSVDSNTSNSEKEEIVLQPLELVMVRSLEYDRPLFDEQESCGSDNSACPLKWADDSDLGTENLSEGRDSKGKTSASQSLDLNNPIDIMQRQNIQNIGFDAGDRPMMQNFVPSQTHLSKIEPLELVRNVRFPFESEIDRENVSVQGSDLQETSNELMDCGADEKSGKLPKKRKNCKLKRSHISVIPGMPETYKCNICGKTFKSPTAQRYHDSCLTGVKPYQCTLCDRSFVKQSHFQYHERTHTGYKPYKCSFCGKAFPQRNKLNRHLHSHQNDKRFKCSICEKGYSSRGDLKSHMNIHTGVMPYTCQVCKKSFREATNLTRHMHTHSDERPHMCEQCGKSFKDKSLLVRHKRTHGKDRPFSCSDCSRVFLSKSELSRHLAIHSDEKPFPCLYCSTVFRRKDNLNRHTRHHHSENRIAPMKKKSKNEPDEQEMKLRPANVPKQKPRPKEKPKCVSALLPKSPAKRSVLYINPQEQRTSRLDSTRSNMIPVIRTTNELSNAVPVINGPISIKRPEEKINSPKKVFTHTEPIPLAEALVINKRIEEKLYPKTNVNHDCYFRPDYRNRVDRQSSFQRVKTLRPNLFSKTVPAGKIYSPDRSFLESRVSPAPINRTDKHNKAMKSPSLEDGIMQREIITTSNECQDPKGMNSPRHTVPKKRAIEEMKSNTIAVDPLDFSSAILQDAPTSSVTSGPERANCVPTITKAGHVHGTNDLKEFNSPTTLGPDNEMLSRVRNVGNGEKSTIVEKSSDTIHWRRRTSEILKPRILGVGSLTDPQISKLENPNEMTDMTNDG